MDYFILDLQTGEIKLYYDRIRDSFIDSMKNCGTLSVYKEGEYKKLVFKKEGQEPVIIVLNKHNAIVGLENPNVEQIGDKFLCFNKNLEKLNLPNTKIIGKSCLLHNTELREVNLSKTKKIG